MRISSRLQSLDPSFEHPGIGRDDQAGQQEEAGVEFVPCGDPQRLQSRLPPREIRIASMKTGMSGGAGAYVSSEQLSHGRVSARLAGLYR